MSQHHFEIHMAEKYGIEAAIFIDNFVFWTRTNASSKMHCHEGRVWSFGTPEFFQNYFPYLSARRIKTILQNCLQNNILIKGNFNKKGYDRTNWYALSDEVLAELNLNREGARTPVNTHRTKIGDGLDKNRRPIPDTKPDTKLTTTTTTQQPKQNSPSQEQPKQKQKGSSFYAYALSKKTKKDERSDNEFLEHCEHHIKNNSDNTKSRYQRERMLLFLLDKLFKRGELFKSSGFIKDKLQPQKENDSPFSEREWKIINDIRHAQKYNMDLKKYFPTDESLKEAREVFSRYKKFMDSL